MRPLDRNGGRFGGVAAFMTSRRVPLLASLAVVVQWIVFVLPPAFLGSLFTLDVGGIFNIAAHFPENIDWILSPYTGSGRYFPLYWLYHVMLSYVFGFDIRGYYVVLAIVFLLSALLTVLLFLRIVRNLTLAVLFSSAIFLSSPNVESVYAIGKAEPFVYLLIAAILLIFYSAIRKNQPLSAGRCATTAALFAASLWFKETAIAMIVFAATGIVATTLMSLHAGLVRAIPAERKNYMRLLTSLAAGYALAKVPYLLVHSAHGSTAAAYTTFSFTWKILADNALFYLTEQPDVTILGAVATILIVYVAARAVSPHTKFDDRQRSDALFVASLVVMAWSYFAIFLFWRWSMAYYLYLPAILWRFAAGYGLYIAFRFAVCGRAVRIASCVALSLSLLHAAVYVWYAAASQVTFSRVYTEAITKYVRLSGAEDSLVFESYPFYAEQVTNTAQLIRNGFRETRRVYGIADLIDPAVVVPEMRGLLSVTDADLAANEAKYPKETDYVIAMTGDELATWQVRGVSPYYSEGSQLQRDGSYDMEQVAEGRAYFPAAFLNIWTLRPDVRQAYVGYQIYKVRIGPRFVWLGRFPDGWIARSARLKLYPQHVSKALAHISTSPYTPGNNLRVFQDDVLVAEAVLSKGSEYSIALTSTARDGPTTFRFEVDQTFSPKRLGLSKDRRELGARLRLEVFGRDRVRAAN